MAGWVMKSGQRLAGWFEPDVAEADGIEVILNEDVVVIHGDVWAIGSLREISEGTEEQ
jgi:hypothetical protein